MPRIDAPTVAEHHAQRRAALLDAGLDLLARGGVEAVTPAAVGAAAGLARSSVYQYFPSTEALLGAIVDDAFPRATEALQDAVDAADGALAKIDAYVNTALALATDRTHRAFAAIGPAALPPAVAARVGELHRQQYAPLMGALTAAGVQEPSIAAQFIGGMLGAAAHAIVAGTDPERIAGQLRAAIHEGIVR